MADFNPVDEIQDLQYFGEFGGVNPSITDSSTYTFLEAERMEEIFENEIEGCYLYSRHWNPSNKYLSQALAKMEGTESAAAMGSGMAAITSTLLQICSSGDEVISSRTIYGGTYAFFKNFLPKFGIKVNFVDSTDLDAVQNAITDKTKAIYCETMSNPLLEISDIPSLSNMAKKNDLQLIVDNTFTPFIFSPKALGADIVVHSMTKFINGMSDCVAGAVCADKEFIDSMYDVNSGAAMLLGPVLDSFRSASILKNLHTLHLRMKKHSENAQFLSEKISGLGIKVIYPGLESHPQNKLMTDMMNPGFGFGGMFVMDLGDKERAKKLMEKMQEANIGYLAVSLGSYKTLFSSPGSSTSSEIPEEEQEEMGMSEGIVRVSIGLDNNIQRTFDKIKNCMKEVGAL